MKNLILYSMLISMTIIFGVFFILPLLLTLTFIFFKVLLWIILFIFILGLVTLFKAFYK